MKIMQEVDVVIPKFTYRDVSDDTCLLHISLPIDLDIQADCTHVACPTCMFRKSNFIQVIEKLSKGGS